MSGENFEAGPWWEFSHLEKPVPLGPRDVWDTADESELIVNLERETIIRSDTEPNLVTLAQLASTAERQVPRLGVSVNRSLALVAVGVLLLGAAAMFMLGWRQGKDTLTGRAAPSSMTQPIEDVPRSGSIIGSAQPKDNVKKGGEVWKD